MGEPMAFECPPRNGLEVFVQPFHHGTDNTENIVPIMASREPLCTSPAAPAATARAGALLDWYDRNARRLPWRAGIGERADPYRVWLSEIMLQQTRAATVHDYYLDFLQRWPTVVALAAASLDDVLKAWAGLGYYARARNLHRCAKRIVGEFRGEFPTTVEGLSALPGIGPYTAGAIAAIAFDRRVAAVDGNAERVLSRLFAIETPFPEAKQALAERAAALVPPRRPGDFVQALMDSGRRGLSADLA